MSSNKNALIRYKTIDRCLRNKYKKYTLEDLIEECSEALFEFEGKEAYVSKRTIQLDIQNMRSEKYGYEAPIEVNHRKYYRYSDPEYSIHNIAVNESDLKAMNNAVQILKQFKDFSMFKDLNGVIQKLENTVHSAQQRSIIHLDKNERLKGLEYIDILYNAILNKKTLGLVYKSFKAREEKKYIVFPQLLKEYNNRWFLICWYRDTLLNLALDRIISVQIEENIPFQEREFNADRFFSEVIGVTTSSEQRGQNVVFSIKGIHAEYVKTKPFHHTQEILEEKDGETYFRIRVQLNFELERVILGFGDYITVHKPNRLKTRIKNTLERAVKNYENSEIK